MGFKVKDPTEPIPLLHLGHHSPPEEDSQDSDINLVIYEDSRQRTGNTWTAVAHIITGVIGSGVLSLAWSFAQLGWIWGPILMVIFAFVTLFSAFLLCSFYRYPDTDHGPNRNASYVEAVQQNLGKKHAWICGLIIQTSLYGTGVAYTITTAICLSEIQKSNCYHNHGRDAPCEYGKAPYMVLFGLVQIVMSQIPDFHSMEWLSILAAVMSFAYALIGIGLGASKVIGNKAIQGSVNGVSTSTTMQKVWRVSQAVGDIAFAYPFSVIALEIQDTLKSPPSESQTMKKASVVSVFITTLFYLSCGGFGYAAFGDQTPGDLLTGFSSYGPHWLINLANSCVVLHLVGGYQVYSQPLFAQAENFLAMKLPRSLSSNMKTYSVSVPFISSSVSLNSRRLCLRTLYVASTTAIAMVFPYFNQVLGVLSLNFWPLCIYFPVEMYLRLKDIRRWSPKWIALRGLSLFFLLVTVFVFAGSMEGILATRFG